MLAVLGRSKVAILLKSDVAMEPPFDIQGLIYISFKQRVTEAALILAKEMDAQGFKIDLGKI
jgi:predicted nucleotide-binding protein